MPEPRSIASPRVAALFVTMDRSETARTCLQRLLAQSHRPGGVFVVDNASTDQTGEMLRIFSAEHPQIDLHVLSLPENLGNAGGMEVGMDEVFKADFDSVWILDDDSWPEPEALEELLRINPPEPSVRSCRVVDLESGDLSWPLQVMSRSNWIILEQGDQLPPGDCILIRRAWLGALLPRSIYDAVGPVLGKLFLRGEDEDYPRRIEAMGFSVHLATRSLLHHPPAGHLLRLKIGGWKVVLESGLKPNNLYYRLRNCWWMAKRDKGVAAALALAAFHFIILLKDRGRGMWFGIWSEALRDALGDRLGRRQSTAYKSE